MKSKRIRFAAKLILCIGIIAALLGCVFALLFTLDENPFGSAVNYVPEAIHFVYIEIGLLVFILIAIILNIIAVSVEKREKVSECFDHPAEEVTEENDEENDEEIAVETVDDAVVAESAEETGEKESSRFDAVVAKIQEKTGMTDEQVETAKKVGKIAVPVIVVGAAVGIIVGYKKMKKKEERREEFFKLFN